MVIDPGHGGRDPGAMANGLREKSLVLDMAKRVKRALEKKGGYEVILTRSSDKFLELEERAMVANRKNADIFVSIHVNASRNKKVGGIETYILNLSNEKKSLAVAARENMVSEREMKKKRNEVDFMLASLSRQTDTFKSRELAGKVKSISGSGSEIVLVPYEEAYPDDFEDMRRRAPDVSLLQALAGKTPQADIDTIIREILSK